MFANAGRIRPARWARSIALLAPLAGYHVYRWRHTTPPIPVVPPVSLPVSEAPGLSFLVPAWNAASDIPAFIAAYRGIHYPDRELVLCAGGSDGSFELAQRYAAPDVIVLEQLPGDGKQGALRKSYPHSSGAIIYLTDVDCRPTDAVTGNLVSHILDGRASVVTGASRPLDEQLGDPFIQTEWAVEQAGLPEYPAETAGIRGCNAALTREALDASGAFQTDAPSGTDYTLALEIIRAGYRIWCVPGHPMPTTYLTARGHIRRQARWIRNVYVLGRRYGATAQVRAALATVALPYALLGGILLGCRRTGFIGFDLIVIAHGILNRVWHQRQARLPLRPVAGARHFVATQIAGLRAGLDLARGSVTW